MNCQVWWTPCPLGWTPVEASRRRGIMERRLPLVAQMGLDVVRLLDHLGIQRAHIVGYSLGAFITGWLLTTYPNRFATATLVAGAPPLRMTLALKDSLETDARELEGDMPFRSLALALSLPGQPPTDSAIRAISTPWRYCVFR